MTQAQHDAVIKRVDRLLANIAAEAGTVGHMMVYGEDTPPTSPWPPQALASGQPTQEDWYDKWLHEQVRRVPRSSWPIPEGGVVVVFQARRHSGPVHGLWGTRGAQKAIETAASVFADARRLLLPGPYKALSLELDGIVASMLHRAHEAAWLSGQITPMALIGDEPIEIPQDRVGHTFSWSTSTDILSILRHHLRTILLPPSPPNHQPGSPSSNALAGRFRKVAEEEYQRVARKARFRVQAGGMAAPGVGGSATSAPRNDRPSGDYAPAANASPNARSPEEPDGGASPPPPSASPAPPEQEDDLAASTQAPDPADDGAQGAGGGTAGGKRLDQLPKRVIAARDQYLEAAEALGKDNPTDREAYNLLERIYEQRGVPSPLPEFSTWTSYLRKWRRATGQQKRTPRAGRASEIGESVVREDQI
ncbi:MAG: hypothetical protein WD009_05520 [Phycisphaeraceae bacterium]